MRRSAGSLILKLSGTLLGLAALMVASSYFGPMVGGASLSQDKNLDKYALYSTPALVKPVEFEFIHSVSEQLEMKEDASMIVASALEAASESLRAIEVEQIDLILQEHAVKLENLGQALDSIMAAEYIPSSLKFEMQTEIQDEIRKASVELKMMQKGLLETVAAELIHNRAMRSHGISRAEEQSCQDQKLDLEFFEEKSLKKNGKPLANFEALSWI